MKQTKQTIFRNNYLMWFGAAISVSEILAGSMLGSLGLLKGLLAIIIGHLIGCFVFLLPVGYLCGKKQTNAIQLTHESFGDTGLKVLGLINFLQLVGWTSIMIYTAGDALKNINGFFTSEIKSPIVLMGMVTILIMIGLLLPEEKFHLMNNLFVLLLIGGSCLMMWLIMVEKTPHISGSSSPMSFLAAIELNISMALSWLPVIGDYNRIHQSLAKGISIWSSLGYFMGSSLMFVIGLLAALKTGSPDFMLWLSQSKLGVGALIVIVLSTVTTTYLDAYSAAINLKNLLNWGNEKYLGVAITALSFVAGLAFVPTTYENFLLIIGAIFLPAYVIVIGNEWVGYSNKFISIINVVFCLGVWFYWTQSIILILLIESIYFIFLKWLMYHKSDRRPNY